MNEKEKQDLLGKINKLTPIEFSKLCVKVVKKIVRKESTEKSIENHIDRPDIRILADIMIKNDIKIDDDI